MKRSIKTSKQILSLGSPNGTDGGGFLVLEPTQEHPTGEVATGRRRPTQVPPEGLRWPRLRTIEESRRRLVRRPPLGTRENVGSLTEVLR